MLALRKGHVRKIHEFFPIFGAASVQDEKEPPLTMQEIAALLTTAEDPMRRLMWAVAIGQGLRPSELVRVHWRDIRLERRTTLVRGDPQRGAVSTESGTVPSAHEVLVTANSFMDRWKWTHPLDGSFWILSWTTPKAL